VERNLRSPSTNAVRSSKTGVTGTPPRMTRPGSTEGNAMGMLACSRTAEWVRRKAHPQILCLVLWSTISFAELPAKQSTLAGSPRSAPISSARTASTPPARSAAMRGSVAIRYVPRTDRLKGIAKPTVRSCPCKTAAPPVGRIVQGVASGSISVVSGF